MDALDIGGFLESIQRFVEERWGKLWAWTIYFGLLASVTALAIWVILRL